MSLLSIVLYGVASAIGTLVTLVTLMDVSGTLVTVIILCLAAVLMVKLTDRIMFFPLWTLVCGVFSAAKSIVTVGMTLDNLIPENDPNIAEFVEIIGDVGTGVVVAVMVVWYIITVVLKFVLPLIISAIFGKLFRWINSKKSKDKISE